MISPHLRHSLSALALTVALAGCDGSPPPGPAYGTAEDVRDAQQLWTDIQGYRSWTVYPGYEGFQPGNSPHGMFLRYFINDVAMATPATPSNGYVIVKENFDVADESMLAAITVMQRVDGYDPQAADWFWVKFSPDGSIDVDAEGVPLAGRVTGCIGCHMNSPDNDFLWVND